MRRPGIARRSDAGGFALIAAITVLILVAALGAMMLRLAGNQQSTTNLSLLGTRAYFAAESGVEWALARAKAGDACPSGSLSLSEGALDGFSVIVVCSASEHVEGPITTRILRITSTARRGSFGERDYASRRIDAMLAP